MVTDQQGVKRGNEILLTDPALHCRDMIRFGASNLGDAGVKRCLDSTLAILSERGWDLYH